MEYGRLLMLGSGNTKAKQKRAERAQEERGKQSEENRAQTTEQRFQQLE